MGMSSYSTAPTRTTSPARARLAGAFIVLWLAVQIAIPLWQRSKPQRARFGWQMYSGWKDNLTPSRGVTFIGVGAGGERVSIRHGRYLVRYRPEIAGGFVERLSAHICRAEPSLRSV